MFVKCFLLVINLTYSLEDFKPTTYEYKFDKFMRGNFQKTDIRSRAVGEKIDWILLKTKLRANVTIKNQELKANEFTWEISGIYKDVCIAIITLNELIEVWNFINSLGENSKN